jgi:hypothetical protein
MTEDKAGKSGRTSSLLGDLESIRSLLDARQSSDRTSDTGAGDDEDVPLLEDVVHGGVSVTEQFLSGEGEFRVDGQDASGLDDDVFKALLSHEWRNSAREVIDEARAAIEQHDADWTPEHTDVLNAAVKARIDATVQDWLRDLVQSNISDLQALLLDAVSGEIQSTIEQRFGQQQEDENPDGE